MLAYSKPPPSPKTTITKRLTMPARKGAKPPTKRLSGILPIQGENNTQKDSNPKLPKVGLRLTSAGGSQLEIHDLTKVNKENQPVIVSPLCLSIGQSKFFVSNQSIEPANNQQDLSENRSNNEKAVSTPGGQSKEPKSHHYINEGASFHNSPTNKAYLSLPPHAMFSSFVDDLEKVRKESQTFEIKNGSLNTQGNETPRLDTIEVSEIGRGISNPSSNPHATKWKKLKSVFRSLVLFQREEVTRIRTMKTISKEVDQFALRQYKTDSFPNTLQISKDEVTREALDFIRRVKIFSELVAVGSPNNIAQIREIIQTDPKRYMRETDDPEHLLNYRNNHGQTPMYTAAKNGTLEVLKLLVEFHANYELKSKVNPSESIEETPLEVAVKWNHFAIVDFLLKNCKYNTKVVRNCFKEATNGPIKKLIREYMKQNKIDQRVSMFACF